MVWVWATLAAWVTLLLSGLAALLLAIVGKVNKEQEKYENPIGTTTRLDVYRRRADIRNSSHGNGDRDRP